MYLQCFHCLHRVSLLRCPMSYGSRVRLPLADGRLFPLTFLSTQTTVLNFSALHFFCWKSPLNWLSCGMFASKLSRLDHFSCGIARELMNWKQAQNFIWTRFPANSVRVRAKLSRLDFASRREFVRTTESSNRSEIKLWSRLTSRCLAGIYTLSSLNNLLWEVQSAILFFFNFKKDRLLNGK